MNKTVGVIGLGKMGMPMARHLRAGGFDVRVFDLNAQAAKSAAEAFQAVACGSAKEVATGADLVIVVVGFDNEVIEVVTGAGGVLESARKDSVIAVASTVSVETMRDLRKATAAHGVHVLDIPLCRGEKAAEDGELLLLAGGEKEIFQRCEPALKSFSSDLHYLGDTGAGQVGKMINNMLLWACVSANYEALKLGEALGVQPETLRQALLKSSGANWALDTWLQPRPMPWAEKDMSIVMEEADNVRLSLPLSGVIREVIKGIKIERGLPNPRLVGK